MSGSYSQEVQWEAAATRMELGLVDQGPDDGQAMGLVGCKSAVSGQEAHTGYRAILYCWISAVHAVLPAARVEQSQARSEGRRERAQCRKGAHKVLHRSVHHADEGWKTLRARAPTGINGMENARAITIYIGIWSGLGYDKHVQLRDDGPR